MGTLRVEDIHYTYEDYKNWEGDWELINGIPIAMRLAGARKHQALIGEIIRQIGNQLENCPLCEVLGEVDYKINEDTVLRPDVVLTCNETNEAYLTKSPEIVVEVVSKTTARKDEVYKFSIYGSEKVKYYILIYPDDLIAKVYKLDGKEYNKVSDFGVESYTFDETMCKVSLDFKKLFARFRR